MQETLFIKPILDPRYCLLDTKANPVLVRIVLCVISNFVLFVPLMGVLVYMYLVKFGYLSGHL